MPPNVSHQAWDALLKKYVTDRGLVGYADWKKNQTDLAALDSYLKQFAEKPQTPGGGNDAAASLINLYNATTIRWILANYPLESIMGLKDSFGANVMISAAAKHRSMRSSMARCGRCLVTARTQYWFAQPGAVRRCNGLPTCHHSSMRKSIAPTAPGSLGRI
jgi:hypothetical protein